MIKKPGYQNPGFFCLPLFFIDACTHIKHNKNKGSNFAQKLNIEGLLR